MGARLFQQLPKCIFAYRLPEVVGLLLFLVFLSFCQEYGKSDPDIYYHFSLSSIYHETGTPSALPNFEGIGWDKKFVDKEFLFHKFTGFAYGLGGENGVLAGCTFLAVSAIVLLLFFEFNAFNFLVFYSVVLINTPFMLRLGLVRPHLLAIFSFVGLVIMLLKGVAAGAFVFGAIFALSYHAIYVPLLILTIFLIHQYFLIRKISKVALAGILGILVGTCVNPFFPDTLGLMIQHLQIALGFQTLEKIKFGEELVRLPASQYFYYFGCYLLMLVLAARFYSLRDKRSWLLPAAAAMWASAALNPRGMEYATPLTMLLAADCIRRDVSKRKVWVGLMVIHILIFTPRILLELQKPIELPSRVEASIVAAQALPPEAKRVFNCEWTRAPYVWYFNPQVIQIDVLDPTFLKLASPEFYEKRNKLLAGEEKDHYRLIHDEFKADYVFCQNSSVINMLEADRRFKRIHPEKLVNEDLIYGHPAVYSVH